MPEKTYAIVLNLLHNNNNYPLIESTLLDLINFFMNRKKQTTGQTPIVPYVAVINLLHNNNNYPLMRIISLLIIEELIISFAYIIHASW